MLDFLSAVQLFAQDEIECKKYQRIWLDTILLSEKYLKAIGTKNEIWVAETSKKQLGELLLQAMSST